MRDGRGTRFAIFGRLRVLVLELRFAMSSLPREWSLIVSGGGSGGHLFPALAVIEQLRASDHPPGRIVALAGQRPIEQQILAAHDIEHRSQPEIALRESLRRPIPTLKAARTRWLTAKRLMQELPSPVVLGCGGAGSLAGVLAARRFGRLIVLLEQNVVPGRATSWLAPLANVCCVSFAETEPMLRSTNIVVTGNPVRREISMLKHRTRNSGSQRVLLVIGGSQGAFALNAAMIDFVKKHPAALKGWRVMHQSGEQQRETVTAAYQAAGLIADVRAFFDDMPTLYEQASLIVSRAGATTLAEIACAGIPAVLVPYPGSVRNHQLRNAQHFAAHHAAITIEQLPDDAAYSQQFSSALAALLPDLDRQQSMSQAMHALACPDAAAQVAEIILNRI